MSVPLDDIASYSAFVYGLAAQAARVRHLRRSLSSNRWSAAGN